MGKKAKYKRLKKLSEQLPDMRIKTFIKETRSGEELIKQGVTEVEKMPVDQDKSYIKKTPAIITDK